MTGEHLQQARRQSKRTQVQAARDLGVSQTYLSLLEKGQRKLTQELERRAVTSFGLQPSEFPVDRDLSKVRPATDERLAADLSALGYPGFSHLKAARAKDPAEVLLSALSADNRDARLVEALPWVVLNYPEMDWNALVAAAKLNDLQNRLGFVTNVARRVAERNGDKNAASKLRDKESRLEHSRLFREETLCNESMTKAERNWLKNNRPEAARYWRLLTNLSPEHLSYYAG